MFAGYRPAGVSLAIGQEGAALLPGKPSEGFSPSRKGLRHTYPSLTVVYYGLTSVTTAKAPPYSPPSFRYVATCISCCLIVGTSFAILGETEGDGMDANWRVRADIEATAPSWEEAGDFETVTVGPGGGIDLLAAKLREWVGTAGAPHTRYRVVIDLEQVKG